MVRQKSGSPLDIQTNIAQSVKSSSYFTDVVYNAFIISPLDLSNSKFGYSPVLFFIYLMSLVIAAVSTTLTLIYSNILGTGVSLISIVTFPFVYSVPLFLLNTLLFFLIQLLGCHVIGKSKSPKHLGIISSIISYVPILVVVEKFLKSIGHFITFGLAMLTSYFIQNTYEMTYSITESRLKFIHSIVMYISIMIFFYISVSQGSSSHESLIRAYDSLIN